MWDKWIGATLAFFLPFDAVGFRRRERQLPSGDLEIDLSGRVYLITGANGGIGLEVARGLARLGGEVILLCRNAERGQAACESIRADAPKGSVGLERLDVSSLESIRAFCDRWTGSRVDALVHNAGLIPESRALTPEGLELTLATHVIGPFLLSRLLEPRLVAAAPGRVIWVSSGGMYSAKLSLDDLDWSARSEYDGVQAYAQTKRMQVILAEQLAAHWKGKGICSHSMHPGWVDTPGLQDSLPNFCRWMEGRLRTSEQGADTVVWLAAAQRPTETSGQFWLDRGPVRTHYLPFTREAPSDREALWALCESQAGLRG